MSTITAAGYIIAALIGAALMWLADRWYYTKDGRAKVKAAEERVKQLEEMAKAQGVILRE